jgi:hypothetical protein
VFARRQLLCYLALSITPLQAGSSALAAASQAADQRAARPMPPAPEKAGARGQSYALCIGINRYSALPQLQTALGDAESVAAELGRNFGFKVEVLRNPDRHGILTALNRYKKLLGPDDALLIYYAGHGYSDDKLQKAYWLPADAQPEDTTNWIIADDITTDIKAMSARHVLVVSDSCYSGGLAREAFVNRPAAANADRESFFAAIEARKSRLLLSSGGNEPVSDGGGDGTHSIFATVLLQSLREISPDRFTVEELFTGYIQQRVGGRSKQVPQINVLRDSGHDGGTFVFERVAARLPPVEEPSVAPAPAAVIQPADLKRLQSELGSIAMKANALNDRLNAAERATRGAGGLPLELKTAWNGMNAELDKADAALQKQDMAGYGAAVERSRENMAIIERELIKQ